MRILAIEKYPTTERGGSERSYFDLLTGLRARGHEIVLVYEEAGNLLDKYSDHGVQVVQTDLPLIMRSGRRWADFKSLLRASKIAKLRKPFDVIYVNNTEALPLASLMKLRCGASLVCHIRVPFFGLTRQILWCGRWVSKFIVINKKLKPVFETAFHANGRVDVVYNGLTIPGSLPLPKIRKPGGPVRLLYLGRIAPEKGVSELVTAFANALKAGFVGTLEITGSYVASHSGDYRSELAEVIAGSGVSNLIEIKAAVSNPITYMANFDLTIFPATWDEPFGRTVPESILAGTPVLARNVGMIDEIMTTNPQFVFDSDEMLTARLIEFYNATLAFDIEGARKWIITRFNKDRMIEEVEKELMKQ